jgi:outer membrane protein assembly factor BamB
MSGLAGGSPVGDPLLAPDGSRLYVPAGGGTYCVDSCTLETIWHAPAPGLYNPARPLLCDAGLAIVVAEHGVRMLDPDTGATRWQTDISGDGGPLACYGRTPHALLAEPALVGNHLVLGGLDGQLRVLDASSGTMVAAVATGSAVAAAPVAIDRDVIVAGLDGTVHRIDVDGLQR